MLEIMNQRSRLLLFGASSIFVIAVIIGLCWPDDKAAPNDNRCILLIGGHDLPNQTDDVEYYHPSAGVECDVKAIGDMPTERIRTETVSTSGCYLASTEQVAIREKNNINKPPMLYGLKDGSATPLPLPYNQYIYGSTTTSVSPSNCISCAGRYDGSTEKQTNKCYQYDPSLDSSKWTSIAPLPYQCYYAASISLTTSDYYVMGGIYYRPANIYVAQNKLYRLNVTNGTWYREESMKTSRYSHGAAVLSATEFIVCGGNTVYSLLRTCEIYNTVRKTWRNTGSLNNVREAFAMIRFKGAVYVLGGWDGSASMDIVEKYDPEAGVWEIVKSMKHHRSFFVGVRV